MKTLALITTLGIIAIGSAASAQLSDGVYTVRSVPTIHPPAVLVGK